MQYPTRKGRASERGKVREDNSTILEFTITDGTVLAARIPKAQILTAQLTLYDAATDEIINNRDRINVMSYITDDGTTTKFLMDLCDDDNLICGTGDCAEELHVAVIEITALSGVNDLALREEIAIPVVNLQHYRRAWHSSFVIGKTVRLMWRVL